MSLEKVSPVSRLTLIRAGASPSTQERLNFAADHSLARDAVRRELDIRSLTMQLSAIGISAPAVRSQAGSIQDHLLRPNRGRRLLAEDRVALGSPTDVAVIVADGLSAGAVEKYAPRLLQGFGGVERATIVRYGRVAIGDEIGAALEARLAIVLIGERPGLSAAESLGIYITYDPRYGRTDAERVCISNVRDGGNPPELAALQLREVVALALQEKKTGV